MKKISLLLFLSAFIISCTQETAREHPRELNDDEKKIDEVIWKATFQDLDGNEIKISDLKGKVVLVDFWETWCGPCLQVFPAMDSLMNEYPDDFAVIAANLNNSDTIEDVQNFQNENDYDLNFVLDNNKIGDEIIQLGIPFKVFIDPEGYLISAELGSAGTEGDYQKAKKIIEDFKKS